MRPYIRCPYCGGCVLVAWREKTDMSYMCTACHCIFNYVHTEAYEEERRAIT